MCEDSISTYFFYYTIVVLKLCSASFVSICKCCLALLYWYTKHSVMNLMFMCIKIKKNLDNLKYLLTLLNSSRYKANNKQGITGDTNPLTMVNCVIKGNNSCQIVGQLRITN